MENVGVLLGRWHQFRSRYRTERGYSSVRYAQQATSSDDDDELDYLTMRNLEDVISTMTRQHQLALQHVARAECLGVEVIFLNALPRDRAELDALCTAAVRELERRLARAGLI